jgi:bifunctional DNA-binding transcriptional regulator/antitoxin component of YhaV-PrlF toxin-antitoxin module
MITFTNLIIEDDGKILIPLEVNQYLNLDHNDWLKVSIESDYIVINPPKIGLDEVLLEELVHEGILIDVK